MISKGQKRWMLEAIGVFVSTSLLAVTFNSLQYGWHWDYSISRYVGLETWSAILFALGNVLVAGLFGRYLYTVSEKWQMPRWFYWVTVVMAMALIGLSVCPIGYFDLVGTGYASSAPSRIHEICSRLMFFCMLLMAFTVQWRGCVQTRVRCCCVMFVLYGFLCLSGYFLKADWFVQSVLVFESAYLLGFMILCLGFQGKINQEAEEAHGRAETRN